VHFGATTDRGRHRPSREVKSPHRGEKQGYVWQPVIHLTLQEARQGNALSARVRDSETVIFILSSQRASKLATRRERAGPRGHCKLKVGARERAGPFVRSNVHREEREERRSREARGQVLQAEHRARETPIIDRAGVGPPRRKSRATEWRRDAQRARSRFRGTCRRSSKPVWP